METHPRFIQGVFAFAGHGLDQPAPIGDGVGYTVSAARRGQLIYFRAGNSADALIAVTLMRDGVLMRTFPVGAKAAIHVPLAVVEDLMPDTRLEVLAAAPAGAEGHVVLDIGLLEI